MRVRRPTTPPRDTHPASNLSTTWPLGAEPRRRTRGIATCGASVSARPEGGGSTRVRRPTTPPRDTMAGAPRREALRVTTGPLAPSRGDQGVNLVRVVGRVTRQSRNRAAGTLVPVKHRRYSNIWVYVPRYQPCLYMCAFQCIGHMVEGSGWRLCIPGSIPVGAIFPLSVCLELEPAGCPEHWSSGHLVLEERAESSPPLPATGSLTCAPALASVSVSSLQGAALKWSRCLP